ncbi:MAG: UDP-N-acetylglucosamine 2-epimerase (non-hydrolyzing) [Elusimicrobia bacterium HGW-Elusimicrobia-1]|nr:MAG: UDP-N-acetylglucosamine 2-epimerase (non-hydrolyzing) [Elusimicrobia bacterium HGW-Elusimicrobia-1]
MKILSVFGTRPEAIKMAPVALELARRKNRFSSVICVTAQHRRMLDDAMKVFGIKSDYDLDIMQDSQSLTHITTAVLERSGKVMDAEKPDLVLVHGDTTTTLAATLAAYYRRIPAGHVEAGLRTRNIYQPFPEEMNRRLTDAVCELHFAPTKASKNALLAENIAARGIFTTGNTVIDALKTAATLVKKSKRPSLLPDITGKFVLMTCHRRENFGRPLREIFAAVRDFANDSGIRVVYPVHPNPNILPAAKKILGGSKNIRLIEPVDYFTLVELMSGAYFVLTDSGGIQEEAPFLKKPVIVLRNISERPEAVAAGAVIIAGNGYQGVSGAMKRLASDKKLYASMSRGASPYGDGRAAARTLDAIEYYFGLRKKRPADFTDASLNNEYSGRAGFGARQGARSAV